jgi:predicted transcriptional regulator
MTAASEAIIMYDMRNTITIRVDDALREVLERRASESGRTMSDVIRDALRDTFVPQPLGERVGHLRGVLSESTGEKDAWRAEIKKRNWRA